MPPHLGGCHAAGRLTVAGVLPSQDPQLRIDSGMHTAVIRRIGVDASCTLLATGSLDKTVRVWGLPDGKLLKTLRAPIGQHEERKVYAVALAPDGTLVALAKATGQLRSERGGQIYIFNSNTGEVVKQLGALKYPVMHLAFSLDGRYLAASFWGAWD